MKDLFEAVGLAYHEGRDLVRLTPLQGSRVPSICVKREPFGRWRAEVEYVATAGRRGATVHLLPRSGNDRDVVLAQMLIQIRFRLGLISEDEYKWAGFPSRGRAA